jgi:hypothetical protein
MSSGAAPRCARRVHPCVRWGGVPGTSTRLPRVSDSSRNSDLGTARGTYSTDSRRLGQVATILLVLGVPATVLAVVFWVVVEDRSGKVRAAGDPLLLPSAVVGLCGGMLLLGVWFGTRYLVRRGEVFEPHDNGLRYS